MAKKLKREQVTPEEIIEVIDPETSYFTAEIADRLGLRPMAIVEVMKRMKAQGLFEVREVKGKPKYKIQVPREVAGPRYLAPMKPLIGYDPGALMRLCNSGRKAETGMA